MGFWYFVCLLTKPPQNLQKPSPTELDKQTAIASKDKGIFLTKPTLLPCVSETPPILVSCV